MRNAVRVRRRKRLSENHQTVAANISVRGEGNHNGSRFCAHEYIAKAVKGAAVCFRLILFMIERSNWKLCTCRFDSILYAFIYLFLLNVSVFFVKSGDICYLCTLK